MANLDRVYEEAGKYWNVDPGVLRAVHQVEDPTGDPQARSKAGAVGHMQFMPQTAKSLGIDPTDPVQSIYGAARLLDENLSRYGNLPDALRAYNDGTDRAKWGNKETMAYPGNVAAKYQPSKSQAPQTDAFSAQFGADDRSPPPTPAGQPKAPDRDAFGAMFNHEDHETTGLTPEARWHQGGLLGNLWQAFKDEENDTDHEVKRGGLYVASHIPGVKHALAGTSWDLDKWRQGMDADEAAQSEHWLAPYTKMAGHFGGDAVLGGGLVGGTRAVGMGLASRLAPQAARSVEAATNLLTMQKGNMLTRSLGGAAQGAGVAEITDQNPLYGAAFGAAGVPIGSAIGAGVSKAANALMPAVRAQGNRLLDSLAPRDIAASQERPDPLTTAAPSPEDSAATGQSAAPSHSPEDIIDPQTTADIKDSAVKLGVFASPKHADEYARRIFQSMGLGEVQLIDSAIPGVKLTAAQATGHPGIALHERIRRGLNPEPFTARDQANNEARQSYLTGIAGTPEQLNAAEAARDAAEARYRPEVFAEQAPVNVTDARNHLARLIDQNRGRDTVQAPLRKVLSQLDAATDADGTALPENLWNVRKYVGDMTSPAARGTENSGHAAAAQLMDFKGPLTETIDRGAPQFSNYLRQYEEMSRPIDAMRYLQGRNLTDAKGEIRLGALDTFVKAITKERGKPGLREADHLTDEQIQALTRLRDDMRLHLRIDLGKTRGSDTQTNLVTQGKMAAMSQGVGANIASWLAGGLGGELLGGPGGGMVGTAAGAGAKRFLNNRLAATQAATYESLDNALLNPSLLKKKPQSR